MFALAALVVPLGLLVLALLVVAVALAASGRPTAGLPAQVASARRHAVTTSLLSALAALVTLVGLGGGLLAGIGTAVRAPLVGCLPLAGAAAALVVLLAGELTWPRPHGSTRTALLHDRSGRAVLPTPWARAVLAAASVLVLGLVAAGLRAAADGRSVTHATATTSASRGPFPGWSYGLPQLGATALCLLLALLVLRAATLRSTVVGEDPLSVETDLLLRRASAARAARALLAGVLVTLGADLLVAGTALAGVHPGGAGRGIGVALALAGPVTLLCGLAVLLVPVPRLPQPAPGPVAMTPSAPWR